MNDDGPGRGGVHPGVRPGVWCTRDVTGLYGADGNLPGILAELRAALGKADWTIEMRSRSQMKPS
jgi:hypothetical protein